MARNKKTGEANRAKRARIAQQVAFARGLQEELHGGCKQNPTIPLVDPEKQKSRERFELNCLYRQHDADRSDES